MEINDLTVDLRECTKEIKKRFSGKDLVKLNEVFQDYEELIDEVNHLKEEIRDLNQDIEENYKPLPPDPDPYEFRLWKKC